MKQVRAKKNLGQHFLNDQNIAIKIVDSLMCQSPKSVLEIGPGMGVLTKYLLNYPEIDLKLIEIDGESVEYLNGTYPALSGKVHFGDFLKIDINELFTGDFTVIGNFPYNISSQIFFKVLDYKDRIPSVVGMIQKEVAERLASPHGSKAYGILSVLLQTFYDIEYLFTVNEGVFIPPPKVKSAVIRLTRNQRTDIGCSWSLYKEIIKQAFNQRRKTMRNSLKSIIVPLGFDHEWMNRRPEQMSVEDFIELACIISKLREEKLE